MRELIPEMNIDIFYKPGSEDWGIEQFNKICSLIPYECIEKEVRNAYGRYAVLRNGKRVRMVPCVRWNIVGGLGGWCEIAIVQDSIDDETFKELILPRCYMDKYSVIRGGI